jgi:hypothetical protein
MVPQEPLLLIRRQMHLVFVSDSYLAIGCVRQACSSVRDRSTRHHQSLLGTRHAQEDWRKVDSSRESILAAADSPLK